MGKEVKIGLAVIGVLLCAFGGVLFMRLRREQPVTAQAKVAAAKKDGKLKTAKKADNKSNKANKEGEAGPSIGSGLGRLSSNRPKGQRVDNVPSGDRYGERTQNDSTDWSTPREGALQTDLAGGSQTEPPDVAKSAYRNRGNDDRYARYENRDEVATDQNGGADLSAPETEVEPDGVAMPNDRFARQDNAGVAAFSEIEGSGEDSPAGEDNESPAVPDPTVEQTADRFVSRKSEGERGLNELSETADDDALRLAPLANDAPAARPSAADRFAQGQNEEVPDASGMPLAAEEIIDDAMPESNQAPADGPRRLPRQFEGDSYTAEPNDNYWRISQKVYGTGAYFKALEEHNRQQLGDKPLINVGDVVSVPPVDELRQNYPELSPRPRKIPAEPRREALVSAAARGGRGGRTYTVSEGDTLFDIARSELGKASRWAEIYELNREQLGEDFNYLAPGMQLALPAGNKFDPVATRPSRESYRR
jgi:nucleoid-associated protein YgaU